MFHNWIAIIIFALLALAGIGLTIVGIGGTFLIVLAALAYNLITWSLSISVNTLLWLFGLAILGEVLEWIITAIGIKASGVSRYALIGTILGAIVGALALSFIPIIGTIIGLFIGALLGAFLLELIHSGKSKKAWKAAKAAFVGRALVSLTKFVIAIVQILLVFREVF